MNDKRFLRLVTRSMIAFSLALTCSVNAADKVVVIPLGEDFFIIPIKSKICAPYTFSQPSGGTEYIFGPGTGNEGTLTGIAFPPFPFEGSSTLVSATMTASIQTPPSEPTIDFFMTQESGSFTPAAIVTDSITSANSSGFGILEVLHVAEGELGYAGASDQVTINVTLAMTNRCPDNTILTFEEDYVVTIQLEPL